MTAEEKRNALDALLQSRGLRRCEQLQRMLRFICEMEFDGRAGELNEYLIGVEALGRPTSYSPAEDSIVRTRAYELRNKLAKYYAMEAPDAPIRIEIDRGAYVPRFVRQERVAAPPIPATAASEPAQPPPLPTPAARTWPIRRWVAVVSPLAACLVLAVGAYAFLRAPRGPIPHTAAWTPEMEAFWKPFLSSETPLLLTYNPRLFLLAPPLDLMVRNWRTNNIGEVPTSPELRAFKEKMGAADLVESRNYVDFGAVYSSFLLMRTVGPRQNQISLKCSKDLDWTDIYNDNIIFLGGLTQADPRLRRLLEAGDFVETVGGVTNLRPKPGESAVYRVSHPQVTGANNGEKFALLSRFPGPQRGRYVMLLGSAHSELPWALAEYITNPLSMRELMSHLRLPSGDLPEAFQVVLRVTLQSQVPVRISYATHHVVNAPEFPYEPNPPQK